MPNVFISSTGKDLQPYRTAAIDVCNRLGFVPIGMEFFGAMGVGATAGSKRKLDEADVYVGTFAYRYGYIEKGYEQSVTEIEFDYAGDRGLKRICFLVDPKADWPSELVEESARERVEAFRSKIESCVIRELFLSVDEYKYKLYQALSQWGRNQTTEEIGEGAPQPPLDLITVPVTRGSRLHFRSRRVPFVGHQKQVDLLEQFLEPAPGFCWTLLTGEAGAGKSRLALELCLRHDRDWTVGFLQADNTFLNWRDWRPSRPTLIVVDYCHLRVSELQAIITSLGSRQNLQHPVRLLLLERRLEGKWWEQLLGSGTTRLLLEACRYGDAIHLEAMEADALWSCVNFILKEEGSELKLSKEEFLKVFVRIDSTGRPLFAALAADALAAGKDIRDWDQTALLRDVLRREEHKYWHPAGISDLDKNLLALATIVGGLLVQDIGNLKQFAKFPTLDDNSPTRYNHERFEVLVGQDSRTVVHALEPDVIGEFFALEHLAPRDAADFTRGGILVVAAWVMASMRVFDFISRALQDFATHPALTIFDIAERALYDLVEKFPVDKRDEFIMSIMAAEANFCFADCKAGRIENAIARHEQLWQLSTHCGAGKKTIIVIATTPRVLEALLDIGDEPRALEIHRRTVEALWDPADLTMALQSYASRADVCSKEVKIATLIALYRMMAEIVCSSKIDPATKHTFSLLDLETHEHTSLPVETATGYVMWSGLWTGMRYIESGDPITAKRIYDAILPLSEQKRPWTHDFVKYWVYYAFRLVFSLANLGNQEYGEVINSGTKAAFSAEYALALEGEPEIFKSMIKVFREMNGLTND